MTRPPHPRQPASGRRTRAGDTSALAVCTPARPVPAAPLQEETPS